MPTKAQLEEKINQLEYINNEKDRIIGELQDGVPQKIDEIVRSSQQFNDFIQSLDKGLINLEKRMKSTNEKATDHLNQMEAYKNSSIQEIDHKNQELQNIHQNNIEELNLKKTEIEKINDNSIEAINTAEESAKETITELTDSFKQLAGEAHTSKSSELIADEYRNNAKYHQGREKFFQYVGGSAIIGAIVVLICWLAGVIGLWIPAESQYHWLPVATITFLFLFLARWSARISYRHGLEARRLNQYALDLTAMPAFFAQELLNPEEDTEFVKTGKQIIQEKASRMFGNVQRFDEQHSHSPMEIIWKWVTNRFETSSEGDGSIPTPSSPPTTAKKNTAQQNESSE